MFCFSDAKSGFMSELEMAILPYQLAIFPVVFNLRKSDTLSPVIFLKKRLKVDQILETQQFADFLGAFRV